MAGVYYWLRFQKDFFKSLRIKKLRKLAGGDTYTIIYLKLQLLSITSNGYLEYKGVFESFEEEMAEEIEESVDNIKITINYLLACGLMEKTEDTYYLPYVEKNIGHETAGAERTRRCRKKKKEAEKQALPLQSNEKALHCNGDVTNCNTEKDIEKDINKNIYIKSPYGEFNNILLTQNEFLKLQNKFPKDFEERINNLSCYIASVGHDKYKSHYATILSWASRDKKYKQPENKFNNGLPQNYDMEEIERRASNGEL